MHTLAKHIETLLVKHNCVVVPGLGGFVTQVQPAHYDEQDGCFVPPKRSVTFNSILSNNDGLLVERYQQYERMSYYAATQCIAEQVGKLKKRVQEEGQVELIGIGTLTANGEYGLKFTPKESGLITPELYALEPVFAEPAHTKKETIAPAKATAPNKIKDESKYYTIRLNKRIVNSVAAAVICVMCYFLVIPTGNITNAGPHMASMFPTQVAHRTMVEKKTVIRKANSTSPKEDNLNKKEDNLNKKEEINQEESFKNIDNNVQSAPSLKKQAIGNSQDFQKSQEGVQRREYVIVMASAISDRYANAFVEKLKKEGFPSPRLINTNGMSRVVIGHFATSEDAYELVHKVTENKDYSGSWVKDIPCE